MRPFFRTAARREDANTTERDLIAREGRRRPISWVFSATAAQFLMEEEITDEFRRECATKIQLGIQRASTIIESLLRFARPPENLDRRPVDLRPVIQEALNLVAHRAKVQKIELTAALPAQPLPVLGTAGLLEQVLMNLLLN